ncbi:MAG: (d)CMP kinase [Actinomycetota bacterium]
MVKRETVRRTRPKPKRRRLVVAIDGPAGSGKTTVASGVARRLRLDRLDTGAMYRAVTLKALRQGIDPEDGRKLARLARETDFDHDDRGLLIDGKRPSRAIRSPDVNRAVSAVSAHPAVRKELVRRQREIMQRGGFVAEGRDIGTVVCPDADVKVFLTASETERADRRHRQLARSGVAMSKDQLKKDQVRRDRLDSTRAVSPLTPARDAHVIDSTTRTPSQVVDEIVALAEGASRARRG